MSGLKEENYIHTLLLYEFNVTFNVAVSVRHALHQDFTKPQLYFRWIKTVIKKIQLPYYTNAFWWWIFRNEEERCEFVDYIHSPNRIPHPKNNVLEIGLTFDAPGICVNLCSNHKEHVLSMKHVNGTSNELTIQSYQFLEDQIAPKITITEEEFYSNLKTIFDVIVKDNRIPFELYGIT